MEIQQLEKALVQQIKAKMADISKAFKSLKGENFKNLQEMLENVEIIKRETNNMLEDVNGNKTNIIFNIQKEPFDKIMTNYNEHLNDFNI